VSFSLVAVVAMLSGCGGRASGPPTPLPVAEIPAELQKAFAKGKPEDQESVRQVTAALQAKDYPAAYQAIQPLFTRADATKRQSSITARSVLTINQLLQEAQAKGDANAAAIIQYNRKYK
jgi:hypothetical protein